MKSHIAVVVASAIVSVFAESSKLVEVYHNNDFQITGVTVSKSGRLFVNFPRWSDRYLNAVVEVMKDGSVKPYPDESWNRWDMKPSSASKQFVCVQSVVAVEDSLWVVDPSAPLLGPVIASGAKLVRIDLRTNSVTRDYTFGADVVKADSYLNDVRVDSKRDVAYMTDSGHGGIVIVDLKSGQGHRALDGNPSVMPEAGVTISVNGKPLLDANGKTPQIASDGIALSPDGEYLYYKALTGSSLYRIKTAVLRQADSPANAVSAAVEKVATTFPTDGLWMDFRGQLYLSDLNHSAVARLLPTGKTETVATDPKLQWPDTFSQGPDGALYITASHINDGPQFNQGKSTRTLPYSVFKFVP